MGRGAEPRQSSGTGCPVGVNGQATHVHPTQLEAAIAVHCIIRALKTGSARNRAAMPSSEAQLTSLFKAAEAGDLEEFQQAAAQLDGDLKQIKAENGANCLHIAAHCGRTELCKYLLDQLQFDVDAQDGRGCSSCLPQRLR